MFHTLLSEHISRRELLNRSCLGAAGWLLAGFGFLKQKNPEEPVTWGRVLDPTIPIYEAPTKESQVLRLAWRDLVLPITEVAIGTGQPAHNRVWYRIDGEGYAHSGSIQPVEIQPGQPSLEIPAGGCLAEVCVPFTEARRSPESTARFAYRIYFDTTYWVTGVQTDTAGGVWYTILDEKRKRNYYANAAHLRLIPEDELSPLSPDIPIEGKRLEIRLAEQVIAAYEWDEAVFMARIASGARFRNGNFTTPTGRYMTYHKRPTRHMSAGDFAAPNSYDLPGVPWVCYFTPEGISIHGTYWHNDFGLPRSHGCINLAPAAAHWVYRWTMPVVEPFETYTYKNFGTAIDIVE